MEINETVRTVAEIGIALLFLVGAIFNTLYTRNHGDEFYGSFAEGAWFPPSRALVNRFVIPHSKPFTYLLIAFQLLVALAILSRGPFVVYGLYAGAALALGAAVVSSVGGAIVDLVLAADQFLRAYTR